MDAASDSSTNGPSKDMDKPSQGKNGKHGAMGRIKERLNKVTHPRNGHK